MRLWHQKLIGVLPRQQLLGQHRECCALRGAGWMRPHATVNYVFAHPITDLVRYHWLVIDEMEHRGYHVETRWREVGYRGQKVPPETLEVALLASDQMIYPEHDEAYLQECLENLARKGVFLSSRF
ncbi:TIGR02328 family protein [Ferroacidibacillus organovorans]|uniref:DNA lyase n=1 Tax=Ferroacidibacillus organovorans TaxID=1765683 RepID=A0A162U057_9BACL|nr:TIGR02328 family protein [Ferroacidibacillus organovorans]KYP81293.1 DNA lyase [Ferroacidibacillus organovorans]OAG95310.1 DNA lyase [Ferroacidibacillus organovorans]OPG17147.1 DNA lyase [Ferroacidibacillus organovorans]